MTIRVLSESGLDAAAREFLDAAAGRRHIAFIGPMGAGKTTFISALCRAAGVTDDVSSPTFSIINEYRDAAGGPVYHFDFYRIGTPEEALDLGLDEYFSSGALCLMEWPENVAAFLPDDTLAVRISPEADGARVITTD